MLNNFRQFFSTATSSHSEPYEYQLRLAAITENSPMSLAITASTGAGKTAATSIAWLWNRCAKQRVEHHHSWPRRLIYCLPMRSLVTQTRDEVDKWLRNLKRASLIDEDVFAYTLMGGNVQQDWEMRPEVPAILIGTQDQLLSRALNRGYAMSRRRWPMHFGLLNNDCLWILDEVQLMGPGLATALQLEAFRSYSIAGKKYFDTERPCVCWYMSATANRRMLTTREWRNEGGDRRPNDFEFRLSDAEKANQHSPLGQRRFATKKLECQPGWNLVEVDAAERVLKKHLEMITALTGATDGVPRRTLVICDRVERARILFRRLGALASSDNQQLDLVLLHSRFRPKDRDAQMERLKTPNGKNGGQIVVATQVVEAGVDVSSGILWSEIAPLPSIIQRLGRLNRAGEFGYAGISPAGWTPTAFIVGLNLPELPLRASKDIKEKHDSDVTKCYLPYERGECEESLTALQRITDASPDGLETGLRDDLDRALKPPTYSLLRHELLDFFDTDSNVSLGYTDVSPFIRGTDPETDVYVLWRSWDGNEPPFGFDVQSEEICQVPIWKLKGKDGLETWRRGYVWKDRDIGWLPATSENLFPGATLLLPISAGGYDDVTGWTGDSSNPSSDRYVEPSKPTDEEMRSRLNDGWQSLAAHTADVLGEVNRILVELRVPTDSPLANAIVEAVRWHDYGKNVARWQDATRKLARAAGLVWPDCIKPIAKFSFKNSPNLLGKTGGDLRLAIREIDRSFAPKLRHEVASALALRQHHRSNGGTPNIHELLAEYLVMSHHGYVRKVLRDELPSEPSLVASTKNDEVRGIEEGTSVSGCEVLGEKLPDTDSLSIECRKMGRCEDGSESWTKSVLRLLDEFGPFRLAFYEAIFRAADWRASADPKTEVIHAAVDLQAGVQSTAVQGANS
jgi:CRISPR-associated endonuclease/helicase Cas3